MNELKGFTFRKQEEFCPQCPLKEEEDGSNLYFTKGECAAADGCQSTVFRSLKDKNYRNKPTQNSCQEK